MARSWHAFGTWALSTANFLVWGVLSKKISVCLFVVVVLFSIFKKKKKKNQVFCVLREFLGVCLGEQVIWKLNKHFKFWLTCASDYEKCFFVLD